MKMRKVYNVPGTDLANSDDYNTLREFADRMGHNKIKITEIEIPWLENGDRIIISKCVGSWENEDGISSGGKWVDVEGLWEAWEQGEYGNKNNMHGSLFDADGNKLHGNVGADMRYYGFPYRNVRLVKTT